MPAGPTELGFVYFAAAKVIGYTAFCHFVVRNHLKALAPESAMPSSWSGGIIRASIGVAVGAVVGLSFWKIPALSSHDSQVAELLFFCLLIPVRIGEWYFLLRTVYRRFPLPRSTSAGIIAKGIFASFALDFFGIITALVIPGGAWIC